MVFGAALRFANLEAARFYAFLAFCAGLVGLSRVLDRTLPDVGRRGWSIVLTLGIVAFSLPLVAYSWLIYPDVLLFAIVAWTCVAILEDRLYAAAVLTWLLPIVHIRAILLAIGFLVVIAMRVATGARSRERVPRLAIVNVALALAFSAIQFRLYGNLTGPAFATTQPSLGHVAERLGLALFDVHQGLLTYAPLYVFALAGLIVGALGRNRICSCALALLALYVVTFMWSDASESLPARFWVAGIPFLAIGLAYWVRGCDTLLARAIIVPVFLVQASNLAFFTIHPEWFLESRRSSLTYAVLYNVMHIDFGSLLPIDDAASYRATYAAPLLVLLPYLAIVLAVLSAFRLNREPRVRTLFGSAALVLVLVPFIAEASRTLPPSVYTVSTDSPRGAIRIVFSPPADVSAVQLDGALPEVWSAPAYPDTIGVRCTNQAGRSVESEQPGRTLILTPSCRRTVSIDLTAEPPVKSVGFVSAAARITVMQRLLFPGSR